MPRQAIIGVMGSGTHEHLGRATELGGWLATLGVHLLTGGGSGVTNAVSRAFVQTPGRRGSVLGILPGLQSSGEAPTGYPNPWVEIGVRTHLSLSGERGTELESRNHINVLTSDVVIALPGSAGTRSEVDLAVAYDKPVAAFIGEPSDIPGLHPEVPVLSELSELQAFVEDALLSTSRGREQLQGL